MPVQKPVPTQLVNQKVKCFGFSTAQSKKPLWFTVWHKSKAAGHADVVELRNVTFELDKAGQAKSRGLKIDGTPSATTLKKRYHLSNPDIFDKRKAPFLFVVGEAVEFNPAEYCTDGAIKLRPTIDRGNAQNEYSFDAHFLTEKGLRVTKCDRVILTVNGIYAWNAQ